MYVPDFFTIFNIYMYCMDIIDSNRESIKYDFNKSNYHYKFEHNFNFIAFIGIDQREIRKHEIVLISSFL